MTEIKKIRIIESMQKWENKNKDGIISDRKIANRLKKEEAIEIAQKKQKPVKSITVTVEWKKSPTWGNCPTASADINFVDGSFKRTTERYYASGCGYDKESTVVAELLNDYLKYKLWDLEGKFDDTMTRDIKPYGIRLSFDYSPYFEGGVGMSCYYSIMEFLGGKLTHVASGNKFDVYRIEF